MKRIARYGLFASGLLLSAATVSAIQQIATPIASPAGIFTNEPTTVTVSAQVAVDAALLPASVNLVRASGGATTVLGRMYDDGTHGDVVAGDGIFTLQFTLNEPSPVTIGLNANAAYRGFRNRVSSPTTSVVVSRRPTTPELDIATDVPARIQELFDLLRVQFGDAGARAMILAALATEPGVSAFGLSPDGNFIWINFASGLRGGIITAPLGTQSTPTFVGGSRNMAIAPYFTVFSPWDATNNVANSLGQTCGGAPTVLKDAQGTVDAFKSLSGAAAVYINTHGVINGSNEVLIMTSEPVTVLSRLAHFGDWALFGRIENWGGYWALRPSFISAHCVFPDSIVFAGLCFGGANQTMANAFRNKGARTYYGYDNIVWTNFNFATSTTVFTVLSDPTNQPEDRTTQKAFDAVANKVDPGAPHANFVMFGDGNVALRSELVVNGRFEAGTLTGWTSTGHGYTNTVTEDKVEGTYSARLGRWDQPYSGFGGFNGPPVYGVEPSGRDAIYQDIDLPNTSATSLPFTFNYNVVTFDGAAYDWLDVTVTDATTGALLAQPVSQVGGIIAGSMYNWGLYYTTGWRSASLDLIAYKGRKVRITFSVQQDGYGDQIGAYIDNVSIRCQ